ncbi:class I SAM-dependent methyltransferase [Streptomyces sp. MUM 203J]|uniref:class I SAM-dependent methyltransferase n=1 Tax=Streptomyces sp. MUM 203J TaxID=2791990 RepID=UPI001F046A27|nr:class I SAM-dependent methyltransferase [Streptomyces sp. MUM 203J]MCH0540768.1 class I SAM-dependent methyltransferase [Streptomyces sp. MUM 203J]
MSAPEGPTLRELAVQALSSVERGYDLLAPKFDLTPFRTPDAVLAATADALRPLGPFGAGLDVCCGTGAGTGLLRGLCRERVAGVDVSAGMLARAREACPAGEGRHPDPEWVRADARALPFREEFDLAVSFGAFGHFLPRERPGLFARVRAALQPGGRFAFPVMAPPRVGSLPYWTLWGFDAAMRVRNALWWPPFVMYYRTFRLPDVLADLERAGFEPAGLYPLAALGRRPDGAPRCRLVVARRPAEDPA